MLNHEMHPNPDYYEVMEPLYLVECDLCKREVMHTDVGTFDSLESDVSILVCAHCWKDLKEGNTIQPIKE